MPDTELERRLAAVERALDGEADHERTEHRENLESRVETLESRVDELDAAVQSIRGFLGGVSAVNESVERRADAAVAAVERVERRLDEGENGSRTDGDDDVPTPAKPFEDTASTDDEPTEHGLRERLRDLR